MCDQLASLFAAGRYDEVVAYWEESAPLANPTDFRWPYSALTVAEGLLRLGEGEAVHLLLDEIEEKVPEPTVDVACYRLAMRARLHLVEGRIDHAGRVSQQAMALVPLVRELEPWAWPTVRYAQVTQVEVVLASSHNDEVELLVQACLADEELYAEVPLERAGLRMDLATAQEDREIDVPGAQPRAEVTLESVRGELESLPASVERDRLLARADLALARIAISTGRLTRGVELLAHVSRLSISAETGSTWEVPLFATLRAQLALETGARREALEHARSELEAAWAAQLEARARLSEHPDGLGLLHFLESRLPLVVLIRLDVALEGEAQGAARALEHLARLQSLGTLARALGAGIPTLAEVREVLLEPDHGLVVILPEARRSLVLAVDRSTILCEEIAGLNQLQRVRARHLGALLAPLPEAADEREVAIAEERAAANELSQLLFTPRLSERLSQWQGVTFVGLDVLGPVAIGWLPLGDAPYLGLVKAWDVLPSLPYGVARSRLLAAAPPPAAEELLLVAGVHPAEALRHKHPELVPLPLSDDAMHSLERSYADARLIAADEATPARVLAEAQGHSVVQFLVHTIHDPVRVRPTGLVLEPDGEDPGVLWADAIAERMSGPLGLVMLTACRSAQAPTRRGDAGSADLGGAWLAAGAPAALVSHSELSWGPTIEFSEAFHRHLRAAGCSPAEALRRALGELEVGDPRTLPFRYGLLEVVGLGQREVFSLEASNRPDRSNALLASACLLLGLISSVAAWAARRTRRVA